MEIIQNSRINVKTIGLLKDHSQELMENLSIFQPYFPVHLCLSD